MILKGFEKHITSKKGAIHVGANIGEERDWYLNQGFDRVLWFEPNIEVFKILEQNIGEYKKQIAFNFGIHDQLTEAPLHISNNGGQSSSILALGTHAISHPEVKYTGDQIIKLRRLDWFFTHTGWNIKGFNFLNIDVQGVELNVMKSLGDLIGAFDYIYTEVNTEFVYEGCSLLSDIDDYLRHYGFERVETIITRANWGDALYVKK